MSELPSVIVWLRSVLFDQPVFGSACAAPGSWPNPPAQADQAATTRRPRTQGDLSNLVSSVSHSRALSYRMTGLLSFSESPGQQCSTSSGSESAT